MVGRLLDGIRIPTPIVLALWIYVAWKCFQSGYLQDAFTKAKEYVRPIKY